MVKSGSAEASGVFVPLPVRPLAFSPPGFFALWLVRLLACSPPADSPPGSFARWLIRFLADSPPGSFAPWLVRPPVPGWFALWFARPLADSPLCLADSPLACSSLGFFAPSPFTFHPRWMPVIWHQGLYVIIVFRLRQFMHDDENKRLFECLMIVQFWNKIIRT